MKTFVCFILAVVCIGSYLVNKNYHVRITLIPRTGTETPAPTISLNAPPIKEPLPVIATPTPAPATRRIP